MAQNGSHQIHSDFENSVILCFAMESERELTKKNELTPHHIELRIRTSQL